MDVMFIKDLGSLNIAIFKVYTKYASHTMCLLVFIDGVFVVNTARVIKGQVCRAAVMYFENNFNLLALQLKGYNSGINYLFKITTIYYSIALGAGPISLTKNDRVSLRSVSRVPG